MAEKVTTLETTIPERPAVLDVLQEHLEEVGYLSIQRRKLFFSAEVPLRRLRVHLERIEAHLDALRIGGPASVALAHAMLDSDDPWFVFAGARVWLDHGKPDPGAVRSRLATVEPLLRSAWREAFRAVSLRTAQDALPQGPVDQLPEPIAEITADAWGWHGLLTPQAAAHLASSPNSAVRRSIARHCPDSGLISRFLQDSDAMVRRSALWSLARANPAAALSHARQLCASAPEPFALRVIALLGERADARMVFSALQSKELAPAALLAFRDLAWPDFAEALLGILEGTDADLASTAMEVFTSLVGPIPPKHSDPAVRGALSPARFHWQQIRGKIDPSKRVLNGFPFPWQGPPEDEPMESVWRRSLTAGSTDLAWLRREVPDGFFTGFTASEAVPGE